MGERLPRRPAVRSVLYLRAFFEGVVGPRPEDALWKLRSPPVAPQPKSEGARVRSVKPRPRRGRAAGSMEERLSRRPAVRSVLYLGAFEGRAFFTQSCGGRGVFGVPTPLENKRESGTRPWWHLRLNTSFTC
ncbi:unnamed protein product, partial [Scytosiphon promiscuus]